MTTTPDMMPENITPIYDKLTDPDTSAIVAEYRLFSGVPSTVTDGRIELSLLAAMEQADLYINNDFDGGPIPASVKIGLFLFANYDVSGADPRVKSEKSSRIAVTYGNVVEITMYIQERYWQKWRVNPGL